MRHLHFLCSRKGLYFSLETIIKKLWLKLFGKSQQEQCKAYSEHFCFERQYFEVLHFLLYINIYVLAKKAVEAKLFRMSWNSSREKEISKAFSPRLRITHSIRKPNQLKYKSSRYIPIEVCHQTKDTLDMFWCSHKPAISKCSKSLQNVEK